MEFELKINITKDDYAAFSREGVLSKKSTKLFQVLFLVILTVHSAQAVFARYPPDVFAAYILPIGLPVAFYFVYIYLIVPLSYGYVYKSDRIAHEEHTMRLKEDGIELKTSRTYANFTLEDFYRVRFGKKIIAIYVSMQRAILIPRHCFSSTEEEKAVSDFIKAHYIKDKKTKRQIGKDEKS